MPGLRADTYNYAILIVPVWNFVLKQAIQSFIIYKCTSTFFPLTQMHVVGTACPSGLGRWARSPQVMGSTSTPDDPEFQNY
jgi:hypothetical protein